MKNKTLSILFLAITAMLISQPLSALQNVSNIPLAADISFEPLANIGEQTEVSFTGLGGRSPYTLYDSEGEAIITFNSNYTLDNLTAGTYNWSLADANSSEVPVNFELKVSEPASDFLVAFVPEAIATVGGKTTALVMASGGKAPYYLILSEGNTIEFNNEYIVNNLSEDSYNWIVTDSNGDITVALDFELTTQIEATILLNNITESNKTSFIAYPNPFKTETTLE
jgi:hypothetical protein